MNPLLETLWTVAVVVAVWASAVGWGAIVWRVAGRSAHLGVGILSALGLAAIPILGGVLDLLGWISRFTIGLLLFGGWLAAAPIGLAAWRGRRRPHRDAAAGTSCRASRLALALALLFVCTPLLTNLGTTWGTLYNEFDDYQAYLAFPLKMLATGSMGEDPFSFRRAISGLGGQSFLHAVLLTALPLQRLNSLEWGLGLLVLLTVMLGHLRERGTNRWAAVGMVAFLAFVPWPYANTTSLVTGSALFYALHRLLAVGTGRSGYPVGQAVVSQTAFDPMASHWRALAGHGVLLGTLCAGLGSLKASHLPGVVALFGLGLLCSPKSEIGRRAAIAAFASAFSLLFLLPWMIGLRASSGTLLYPIFGSGVLAFARWIPDMRNPVQLLLEASRVLSSPSVLAATLAGIAGTISGDRSDRLRRIHWAATFAVPASALLIWAVAPSFALYHLNRYFFPFSIASLLYFFAGGFTPEAPRATRVTRTWSRAALASIAAAYVILHLPDAATRLKNEWYMLLHARHHDSGLALERDRQSHEQVQAATPRGATVLAYLSKPFLLDFSRNPVFVLDIPGGASLPPGMPLGEGAESLARYLRGSGIRYVTYSHGIDETIRQPKSYTGHGVAGGPEFERQLEALTSSYRILTDSGSSALLDLCGTARDRAALEQSAVCVPDLHEPMGEVPKGSDGL